MVMNIHATITLDGFIADEKGNEDLFDESNYESMVKLSKEHTAILWGRKTYEMIASWGEEYLNCLNHLKIYVLTSNKSQSRSNNIIYINDIKEIGDEILLVDGGQSVYEYALKNFDIKNIYLNIAPVIIKNGLPFVNDNKLIEQYNKIEVLEKSANYTQIMLHK